MPRRCYASPTQVLIPDFQTKTWSASKVSDDSVQSLDGLADAFTQQEATKWPQAFPEHSFSLAIYGVKESGGRLKRVYDIKYFEAQGVVASHGKYHTGPAFVRNVSTLDDIVDAFVEAKAAMHTAFPSSSSDGETHHREAYFSCVTFWSGPKGSGSCADATNTTNGKTDISAPEPEPEIDESDGPACTDLFGDDDDDDW